jgi:hypothetical protein
MGAHKVSSDVSPLLAKSWEFFKDKWDKYEI